MVMAVSVADLITFCLVEAERMESASPRLVVVGADLHRALCEETGTDPGSDPVVAGRPVVTAEPAEAGEAHGGQIGDIAGPDRVSVYVGQASVEGDYPLGHDPAMPVFFVPVPPRHLDDETQIGIYNHLRWYGLDIEQSYAGARQGSDGI